MTSEESPPAETMEVTWSGLTVSKVQDGGKILHGLEGRAEAGRLLAVMGATGSGKTTLLSSLGRRLDDGLNYSGSIRYGGLKWSKSLKRYLAFVDQDDVVFDNMTVRETLAFSAALRLPSETTKEERDAKIDDVLKALKLTKAAETKLGNAVSRGVSGGERKRTCVARELLTDPRVLMLDEPTTGLDSSTALVLVRLLKNLARERSIAVLATIHQPSSHIFEQTDDLLVLAEGKTFYRGESSALAHWLERSLGRPVPSHFCPTDFMMDLLVLETLHESDEAAMKAMKAFELPLAVAPSDPKAALMRRQSSVFGLELDATLEQTVAERYQASWTTQVRWLLWRYSKLHLTSALFSRDAIVMHVFLVLAMILLWFQLDLTEDDARSRFSLAFWLVGECQYLTLFGSTTVFADDAPQLRKELFDNTYRLSAYYVAKSVVNYAEVLFWPMVHVPFVLLGTTLVRTFAAFVEIWALFILTGLVTTALGVCMASMFSEYENVMVAVIVIVTYAFAFSGLFVLPTAIPAFVRWIYYGNYFTQIVVLANAITFNSWEGIDFTCSEPYETSVYASCVSNGANGTIQGSEVQAYYGLDGPLWLSCVILVVYVVVFRLVAFWFLRRRHKQTRRVVEPAAEIPRLETTPKEVPAEEDAAALA